MKPKDILIKYLHSEEWQQGMFKVLIFYNFFINYIKFKPHASITACIGKIPRFITHNRLRYELSCCGQDSLVLCAIMAGTVRGVCAVCPESGL